MEKPRIMDHQSHRKLMKTNLLCIPSLKTNHKNSSHNKANNNNNNNKALTPATLFERFREAVFRLIFLSAVSSTSPTSTSVTSINTSRDVSNDVKRSSAYDINDHHHSEAVADCIEFIKKKAGPDEAHRGSDSASSVDSTSSDGGCGVVVPVQQFVL